MLGAIEYCHTVHNICHRDLKPENFLYTSAAVDSEMKIIDLDNLSKDQNILINKLAKEIRSDFDNLINKISKDYYDNINKSSDKKEDFTLKKNKKYKVKEPKENKKKIYSVIDFFNDRAKTENNTESSNTSFK